MGRTRRQKTKRPAPPRRRAWGDASGRIGRMAVELTRYHETGPILSGGDLDADWQHAHLYGDEAVGGSVATPDQDMVDEIGRALGVEQDLDAELWSFDEILRRRDRNRWALEAEAALEERWM
ncbi:MAG TPA: DUF6335 family protein [Thermodesulfobacteriota bacterium]